MKIWNINKAGRKEIKYVNLSSMPVFKVANIVQLKQESEEKAAHYFCSSRTAERGMKLKFRLCYFTKKNAEKNKISLERT